MIDLDCLIFSVTALIKMHEITVSNDLVIFKISWGSMPPDP